jgi:hypothetical protein
MNQKKAVRVGLEFKMTDVHMRRKDTRGVCAQMKGQFPSQKEWAQKKPNLLTIDLILQASKNCEK